MSELKPVIAVIGAGAVGSYYGGRLAEHGFPVHFLLRREYENVCQRGLIVQSPDGDFNLPPARINAYRDVAQMPKADLVIVTLKSIANDLFGQLITPLLKPQTMILTLQNGLGNEDQLAGLFGAERILGGLAFVCINRLADGTIVHLDHGHIGLGEFAGPPRPRTLLLADWLATSKIPCEVLQSLARGRWEKLVWNVPFNGLGAVLDKTTDKLIATEEGRRLVKRLMLEVIAAARANGIDLPADLPDRKIESTRSMGSYRTSMQIDRQEGRPLEIEAILLRPLAAAREREIAVPYMQMLYDMAVLP